MLLSSHLEYMLKTGCWKSYHETVKYDFGCNYFAVNTIIALQAILMSDICDLSILMMIKKLTSPVNTPQHCILPPRVHYPVHSHTGPPPMYTAFF